MTGLQEFESELHRTAIAQLDAVAERLLLDPNIHARLRYPRRALVVTVPVLLGYGIVLGYYFAVVRRNSPASPG